MMPSLRVQRAGHRTTNWGAPYRPKYPGMCQCECHQKAHQYEAQSAPPPAEVHWWCGTCADERFTPWTVTLDSLT